MLVLMMWRIFMMMLRIRRMGMMMILTGRSDVRRMMFVMVIRFWRHVIVLHTGTSLVVSSSLFWRSGPGSGSSVIMKIIVVLMVVVVVAFWAWALSDRSPDSTFSHWTSCRTS